ncbi:MAG: hypothetical protein U1F67_21880 [Rubrivivax sp.]
MSRDWLLYLDDLIAAAEKIGRLVAKHDMDTWRADEAAFDAVLFNLQVVGEAIKQLPEAQRNRLPQRHRSGPARLRDLIAHHSSPSTPRSSGTQLCSMCRCCWPKRCGCARKPRAAADRADPFLPPGGSGRGAASLEPERLDQLTLAVVPPPFDVHAAAAVLARAGPNGVAAR